MISLESLNIDPFSNIPSGLKDLFRYCLDKDPKKRPTFSKIVNVIEEYYWQNYKEKKNDINLTATNLNSFKLLETINIQLKQKDEIIKQKEEEIIALTEKIKKMKISSIHENLTSESSSQIVKKVFLSFKYYKYLFFFKK